MTTNISQKHIDWIDGAKGIAILLVMFAHTHCPDTLVVWIYSFHIPFFFFLSGLTFSPFKYRARELVSRKFKRLVVPALIFSVIIFVYNVLVGKADLSVRRLVICVISEVLQLRGGVRMSGPWFLISLFVAEIFLYIFINKLGNKKSVIVCFVLGIIGTTYMTFMSTYLPWSIDATCISIVYVYLGYQFKLHFIDECRKDHSKYAELTAMIVLASINIISCILNFKFTGAAVDLYATVLGNPILYWIESISGTFSLILLIIMVYNFLPIRVRMLFEKCGSCSILLYMAHGIIFDLLNRILLYSGVYYESFGMVSTFCLGVCYVAFATLLLLLAYKPLSNYCPLVVGVLKRN